MYGHPCHGSLWVQKYKEVLLPGDFEVTRWAFVGAFILSGW